MKKQYDVIIVGTGVAGCFTALHLPEDTDILMITKGDLEESDSFLAQGGICVQKNDADYDSFYEDTMRAGHYENSPGSVELMIRNSRSVIKELIGYGVEFEHDDQGLSFTREGAHSTNRILYHDDMTGQEITSKLLMQVQVRKNITIMTSTTMVDILCREGACEGILVSGPDGSLSAVFADDVMWACGGIGGIYSSSTKLPASDRRRPCTVPEARHQAQKYQLYTDTPYNAVFQKKRASLPDIRISTRRRCTSVR